MKVKIIEANRSYVFEDNLNEFLETDIQISDIKYSTSGSQGIMSTAYNYSAMVLYNDKVTPRDLMKELDMTNKMKLAKREYLIANLKER